MSDISTLPLPVDIGILYEKLKFRSTCEFDGTTRKFNLYTKLRQYLHCVFFSHVGKLFSIGFQEVNSIRREFAVYAFFENNSDNKDHNEEHAFPIKPGFNYEFCKRHRFLSLGCSI